METSLCVMSRADNSYGLTLASSPKFKEVFGQSNVGRARDFPFLIESRKFNYAAWYKKHTDINGQKTEPTIQHVAFVESWAKRTYIVPPQMALYIDYNLRMNRILQHYTSAEEIHSYSIDESFLDVTESLDLFFPTEKDRYKQMDLMAQKLQKEVLETLGLYITVGMGDNPLLAKIAMDNYAKHTPTMRSLIRYEDVPEKVWSIPKMTDFWGIGKGLEKQFNKLGIHTVKELALANPNLIKSKMGLIGLQEFFHANGVDETFVKEKHVRKSSSFSNSQILPRDYTKVNEIELIIREMAEKFAIRLRKGEKLAGSISLLISFSYQSHQSPIHVSQKIEPTQKTFVLQDEFISIFRKKYKSGAVRQVGVGVGDLSSEHVQQLSLFDMFSDDVNDKPRNVDKEDKIQKVIDDIRDKFDFASIKRASSLTKGPTTIARNKMIGGHAAEKRLNELGIRHSYSLKGYPNDNSAIESFHASLKKEEVYQTTYPDFEAAKRALFSYIEG
ncbi:putative DNA polymierase involved in UV protection [Lactococcus fujiensis JCM 16395]|uniref:Putative DNA polymierase involved in UV protection n=1 Tax=Lactococcus fujiensis JCM 16395 TaxID=1291764 RepID=A0A2A5RI86_9LACT|nr:putative DNA polymierase involved in UV protection [Lactococcus fujiensis JCM 16395]